jgi:hypothetical protein
VADPKHLGAQLGVTAVLHNNIRIVEQLRVTDAICC